LRLHSVLLHISQAQTSLGLALNTYFEGNTLSLQHLTQRDKSAEGK
jgi:hypothetical protein